MLRRIIFLKEANLIGVASYITMYIASYTLSIVFVHWHAVDIIYRYNNILKI